MKKEKKRHGLLAYYPTLWSDIDWQKFLKKQLPSEKKLIGKVVLITGGDNPVGRAVAVNFAAHGAKIALLYWKDREAVNNTAKYIERLTGTACITIRYPITREDFCIRAVETVVQECGQIDVLVNNAGSPFICESIEDITNSQLEQIFQESVFPMFYLSKAVLPYMKKGDAIINVASITSYCEIEIDYSATQGAIVSFTRSLSVTLAKKGIRVNGIVPGTCTPFIPTSYEIEEVEEYGVDRDLILLGKSHEIVPSYLYLASDDSSGITGQFIYPNGIERITLSKN